MLALTGAVSAVSVTPAAGAPAPIRILSVSAENVKPGDAVRVRFRVTNTGDRAETAIVVVGGGLACATGCRAEPNLEAGRSRDFAAKVVAPPASPGETSGLNISVAVRLGGRNHFDYKMVYVHGAGATPPGASPTAAKPSTRVARVSGRVRDTGGTAVAGTAVTIVDSAGHRYRTTSDRSGRFAIRSSAGKPVATGPITIAAALDGYRTARTTVQAAAGDTASVRLTLTAVAAPTTTPPSPETPVSPLTAAGEPVTSAAAADPALEAVSDEGSGSLLSFTVGGLLVAVGLGALALVAARRRNTRQEAASATPAPRGLGDAPTAVLRMRPPTDR